MSQDQSLRELVNGHLTVAAEEICLLFETTIALYKEELCRLKEENQKKQQLLDSILYPAIELVRVDADFPPGPDVPEERCIKQEEELLFSESTVACVKREESSSPLKQKQTERTQREDISSDCAVKYENSSVNDKNWVNPSSSSACSVFDNYGDHYLQGQIRKIESAPETCTFENSEVVSDTDGGAGHDMLRSIKRGNDNEGDESLEHEDPVCTRMYKDLQSHMNIHAGERPFSCSVCMQLFPTKDNLFTHERAHMKERPYCCLICRKAFTKKANLKQHSKIHTGEKPFSCRICEKPFRRESHLRTHMRTHTGEKPFTCTVCNKTFSRKSDRDRHERKHTGEKTFSCSVCKKSFRCRIDLHKHRRTHTGEKP